MTYAPSTTQTAYVPTFRNFQVEEDQLGLLLQTTYSDLANAVNIKTIGTYDLVETVTGNQFFTPGNAQKKIYSFRQCYQLGAIAAGAASTFSHNIAGLVQLTNAYGSVITDVIDYRPVPFADVTNVTNQISIVVTSTQITVTNGATAPAITSGIITLEYLRNS